MYGGMHVYNRQKLGLDPRVSRLAHEHSTTEQSKFTHFCYSTLGFFLATLSIVSCVCMGCGIVSRSDDHVSRGYGRGTCMYVCRLLHGRK